MVRVGRTRRVAGQRAGLRELAITLLVLVTAVVSVALLPSGAASAATELEVEVGVDGRFEPNDAVVVHVTITAGELIDGELVAAVKSTSTTVRQAIQVPAGTTKDYYVTVPSSWDAVRVEVSVRDGDGELASETATGRVADSELVGVLPRLLARIGELPDQSVALGPDEIGDATIAALPLEVVDLGVSALRSYDSVVAASDDLAGLDDAQRATLWAWVSTGGMLLLDDEAAVAALPSGWEVGPAGYAFSGLGEVRLTDGGAAAGRWEQIIQPTAVGNSPGMFAGTEMNFGPDGPNGELAARAGLDLPSIAPLALGLGIYGLVLGPVVYLVLRRMRRLTLGWFVIPALAVLAAGGVALAGGGSLRSGDPAASAFVQSAPGGVSYAVSNVLTFSSDGGSADLGLPPSWALQGPTSFWGGDTMLPVTVERHGDGTSVASVELEATQASVRSYAGVGGDAGLTLTAGLDEDGNIVGTVTNDTDHAFVDVAVFAGNRQVSVGFLEAGAEETWKVTAPRDLRFGWESRGSMVWGQPWDDQGRPVVDDEVGVEWGVWAIASQDLDLFPTGMVRVVGWTDDETSPLLDADASTITGVSTLEPIDAGGRVNTATVRATAVRGPFGFVAAGSDQVIRYVLPPDAAATERPLFLVGADDVDAEEVSFWDGERWLEADASLDAVPVPAEAVRDGVLLARTDVQMDQGPQGYPTLTDEEPE